MFKQNKKQDSGRQIGKYYIFFIICEIHTENKHEARQRAPQEDLYREKELEQEKVMKECGYE